MQLMNEITKKQKTIYHEIYMFKILLLIEENQDIIINVTDKLVYAESLYQTIYQNLNIYMQTNENDPNQVLYNLIDNDFYTLNKILQEIKDDLYNHFRLTILVIIDQMKNDEITIFYDRLQKKLASFKNLTEACTYIYYHSGSSISTFITNFINYVENNTTLKTQKLIGLDYYKTKQVIITIYYKEWIEIFEHLRFAMKYLKSTNPLYNKLNDEYQILLIDSFIIVSGGNINEN